MQYTSSYNAVYLMSKLYTVCAIVAMTDGCKNSISTRHIDVIKKKKRNAKTESVETQRH